VTAPFRLDVAESRLSVNPGPWGVAVSVHRHGNLSTITMTPEQATKVAAALILAAASTSSHQPVYLP